MKIAIAQLNPIIGNFPGNVKNILQACENAERENATIILTPELSLLGYPPRDLLLNPFLFNEQIRWLDFLSNSLNKINPNLFLLVGIAEPIKDNRIPNLFNSIALLSKGQWKIIARKQLLPTYDIFDEKRYFRNSNKSETLVIKDNGKNWKIGITICEDIWVEDSLQEQRLEGPDPIESFDIKKIDFLINLSASPFNQKKKNLRHKIVCKAARRLNCPVIYVNQVGGNDELIFDGSSFVMDENGQVEVSLPMWIEALQIWSPNDRQKCSLTSFSNPTEDLFRSLVLGVKDYVAKCGFKTVVLGLSGGIDSALVATIATAALGNANIHALLMPSPWSSKESIEDALELSSRLGINHHIVQITDLMQCFDSTLTEPLGAMPKGITAENLQSRIRGTLLMAMANQHNHLLLSTGNKSELAVGYCTLYGDMNGGLSVIGDLYKTEVFELCEWLDSKEAYQCRETLGINNSEKIIGSKILQKPPSAELRKDQLDTDSLPDYSILDPILKGLIEEHLPAEELIKSGYEKNLINQIEKLIKRAEFKRRQAPPVLKVSNQAFGSGWRKPIATT